MNEIISRCGYCGDVIDYCQGHGEDERAEFGFEIDSDEYEKRREVFEAADVCEVPAMIVTLDFLECDDCGYTDDGSGIRTVRQYDGGKQAKGLTGILCDFCGLMAERAAAAASKPRYRSLPGDFNELTRDDDGYRADIDAGLV